MKRPDHGLLKIANQAAGACQPLHEDTIGILLDEQGLPVSPLERKWKRNLYLYSLSGTTTLNMADILGMPPSSTVTDKGR